MPCTPEMNEYKQNRLPLETSSAKFSATTNFLFSLSWLHILNKGIFHYIAIQNDNRKAHVESTRAMTRERSSRAESSKELQDPFVFTTADGHFGTKVIVPHRAGLMLGQIPHCAELNSSQMPRDYQGVGDGRFWN